MSSLSRLDRFHDNRLNSIWRLAYFAALQEFSGDAEAASDVAQEVICRFTRDHNDGRPMLDRTIMAKTGAGDVDPCASFKLRAYVRVAARNCARSKLRRKRYTAEHVDVNLVTLTQPTRSVSQLVEDRDLLSRIAEINQTLPPLDRDLNNLMLHMAAFNEESDMTRDARRMVLEHHGRSTSDTNLRQCAREARLALLHQIRIAGLLTLCLALGLGLALLLRSSALDSHVRPAGRELSIQLASLQTRAPADTSLAPDATEPTGAAPSGAIASLQTRAPIEGPSEQSASLG